jgi:uncharacterized membrane protein (UPF0127 family)
LNISVRSGGKEFPAEVADSPFQRMCGLMFSAPKSILFIFGKDAPHPIHSFFVFHKFDAIYLDESKKITGIFRSVPPFALYLLQSPKPARYLLETPEGQIRNLKAGDSIDW